MEEKNNANIVISKEHNNLFNEYDKHARKSRLKASLDN
jgi:hypothetical protein